MTAPQRINPARALQIERRAEQRASSVPTTPPEPPSPATLAKLWLLGIGAWGHRWTTSLGELPVDDAGQLTVAGRLWGAQLAGLPEADLLDAVQHFAARLDWPMSLAELRKHVLGIPSLDAVAADMAPMHHRFTRLVWRHLDHWKFARADSRTADRLLRAAYAVAVEKRMAGAPLPERPVALVAHRKPQRVPARPETAQRHIDAMREQLHIDPGDVAAEGLPALELSPIDRVGELRANCIAAGLHPDAMALEVAVEAWKSLRDTALRYADADASAPSLGGFPVRVVRMIPGGKDMRLVRA